jgi:hypothetical protein
MNYLHPLGPVLTAPLIGVTQMNFLHPLGPVLTALLIGVLY